MLLVLSDLLTAEIEMYADGTLGDPLPQQLLPLLSAVEMHVAAYDLPQATSRHHTT